MKSIYLFLLVGLNSLTAFSQVTTTPSPFEANQSVTLNFDKTGTGLASYTGTIYAHIGVTVNGTPWQNVIGSWGNNTTQPALTFVSGSTYSLTISPDLYTYFGVPTTSTISQICVVFRNAAGTAQTSDIFVGVGSFQATLNSPAANSVSILNSGASLAVTASNTGGSADYNLLANGVSINTFSGTSYSFTDSNITSNKNYELQVTQGTSFFSKTFSVIVNPGIIAADLPAGMEDGINYDPADNTKATLVLTAPGKDFVYVAGSFNNWNPGNSYAMKKSGTEKFWLEITGLTPGVNYSYQYWVVDTTPATNSPSLVKTADPYSTLILSPFDDPYIPATSYPDIPAYPDGQEREVTVLKTGQTPYNWQVTDFVKPEKEKLVVYEVLVRDFDANRNFQDLIDKIDYFQNLKVNAIELMPVMEFEGDESWGYNTDFHMALDKFYGTADKLKELVDLCHQKGIAVILDVALNHAFDHNPMVRMWMNDPDGDGYGSPSAENPYFNQVATHAYSVGNDFNHSSAYTKYYVKRVIKQWIQEFKIDGFRWDLTKGFTQACTANDETCTNNYQQDRVDILKDYADYSWGLDPTHYTIFEHLGIDSEEQQWANYRINETPSKGVMMWGKMTDPYNQLSMGYISNSNINRMGSDAHGFTAKRVMGYAESHDEERLMYKNLTYGNSINPLHDVKDLNTALSRMSAIGAVSLLVPGPKMIWHFGELGYDPSIFTCSDGTVNTSSDAISGDCKLSTKPQPQWGWPTVPEREQISNDWRKMIQLKTTQQVFSGSYTLSNTATLQPRLTVNDETLPTTELKNVVVLTNFDVVASNVTANFPYAGTWYDLMDNSTLEVTNTAMTISIEAGQFRIYGNQLAVLATDQFDTTAAVSLYPNPSTGVFNINTDTSKVEIWSLTGQLVKRFPSAHDSNYSYDISDLNAGLYIIKATDQFRREKTMKLIKE
jgi:1,4-alpha-glucan branching enzyme